MARQETQVRLSEGTREVVRYIQVRLSEGFVGHKDKKCPFVKLNVAIGLVYCAL